MYIVTIDSGTTNTRIHLVNHGTNEVIDIVKKNVGVKNTSIEGSNDTLRRGISTGIQELLNRNKCRPREISYIVATGMITSNLGIHEVPHINGPATVDDFVKASVVKTSPEFLGIPCVFVPGLQNTISDSKKATTISDRVNLYDVMRGEEVESFGLLQQMNKRGKGLFVLPGSHTKYVFVNNQTILSCLSTLTGEMLYALQKDTILSSSLNSDLVQDVEESMLREGYLASEKYGLARALYHVRLLDLFKEKDENDRANYFLGAVLTSDLQVLQKRLEMIGDVEWIVIGGSNPLRRSFTYLFNQLEYGHIVEATDTQVQMSTIIGGKLIAEKKMG